MKLVWSDLAKADLAEIGSYNGSDDADAARRWLGKLIARAKRAAQVPGIGRVVPEYGMSHIREVTLRTYRIVYAVEDRRVVVLTVFEGHKRPPPLELLLIPER